MARRVSESTEALLDAFEADFQRQLRQTAVVERIVVREGNGDPVTLVATVRVAARSIELTGSGENLLTAYASLSRTRHELILRSAYSQVLDELLGV